MTTRTARRAKARPPRRPTDPVSRYALDVTEGRIPAGRLVRLACARHRRDLIDGPARGLTFDPAAAQHALDFFARFLVLPDGAHAGEPFVLSPCWAFVVGSLFGWRRGAHRRFRTAYIEAGKGSAKTPVGAGIMAYLLLADGAPGAQIYCAAVSRDQAHIPFRDAGRILGPLLRPRVEVLEHNIAHVPSGSFLRPISSEGRSLDGKRVHGALIDEIHEHRTGEVVAKIRAGTKGNRDALLVEITNSGYDRTSICWTHHEHSSRVVEGLIQDDEWFAYVCGLDPCEPCRDRGHDQPQDGCAACDDWRDPAVWPKANPNLGKSIPLSYLEEQVREAVNMPSEQNRVKRLNFCLWTQAATRWFTAEQWAGGNTPVLPESLRGRRCVAGVDLATVNDLAALVLVFPDDDFFVEPAPAAFGDDPDTPSRLEVTGGVDVLAWAFCPEDGIRQRAQRDRVPYEQWRQAGHLEATPGNAIDHRRIRAKLRELRDTAGFDIAEVAFDPAYGTQFSLDLQDQDGFTVVAIPQGFQSLNEPCMLLETLVTTGRLRHGGHPALAWCAANVVLDVDNGGRKRPSKGKSTERIDLISALVTALRRVGAAQGSGSVYDTRGLVAL